MLLVMDHVITLKKKAKKTKKKKKILEKKSAGLFKKKIPTPLLLNKNPKKE